MLTKMYLTNFLSFCDRTELDFTASKDTILSDTNVSDNGILKGALVIGANASGKSNVLRGLKFIINLIKGDGVPVSAYRCNFAKTPITSAEYEFIFSGKKVSYTISFDVKTKSLSERLLVDEKEVFRLAKTLGIEEKLFQMPDELSGGQQQRAAIARAVYTHPTILVGAELTGNLDSRTSASVMELLKKICRQYQQTMLVVTHDKKVAAMADRIIRMKDGRVVEDEKL